MYCFDTDTLSAVLRRAPPLHLIRRLAVTPPSQQFTTSITYGEMIYGAAKRKSVALADRIRALLRHAVTIVPFDDAPCSTMRSPSSRSTRPPSVTVTSGRSWSRRACRLRNRTCASPRSH